MKESKGSVIIDADACPKNVKNIISILIEKYGWEMVTVASFNHNMVGNNRHITVGNEAQAVDLAIINLVSKRDIVVTQDWGLAAVILGKGARVLSPQGVVYREEKIDFLLEERHLKARFRRTGGRTKGPAARTKADDERFRRALERMLGENGEQNHNAPDQRDDT